MNVLLLAPEIFRAEGGIARLLRVYLQALSLSLGPTGRLECIALNDSPVPDPRRQLYDPSLRAKWTGCDRGRWAFVRATLRAGRDADLIVCGHVNQLVVAWIAALLWPQLRYVLIAHGIEVWRPFGGWERRALHGAHRIICVSDYTRRQLLRFCPGLDPSRLQVLPNPLDPHCAPPAAGLAVPSVNAEGPVVLSVGRLDSADAYKGFDFLIESLARFRVLHPGARLRIVGQGDDRPRLQAVAEQSGIADAVSFLGGLDDAALRSEYAACDLFALPSRREGFGLVFLEAMAHGKPCVGAAAGGIPEVVTPAVGELVPYGDAEALAVALDSLVRHPRDSAVVRAHAAAFAFPAFQRRLAALLA